MKKICLNIFLAALMVSFLGACSNAKEEVRQVHSPDGKIKVSVFLNKGELAYSACKENVEIIWGNILREANLLPATNYKLIANLPYQITSNVIRLFLESQNKPEVMVLMVQKEVAERICAKPGDMSILAVSVQYYADPEIVQAVPRNSFWPEPAVDSAVIKITPKKDINGDCETFFRIVKIGFSNKRKLLIKNLLPLVQKDGLYKLGQIFFEMGFDRNIRAQELSIDDWKKLSHLLAVSS